jgi:hypothetical protein
VALVDGIFNRDNERPPLVSLDGAQAYYYESEYLRRRENDSQRHRPRHGREVVSQAPPEPPAVSQTAELEALAERSGRVVRRLTRDELAKPKPKKRRYRKT